MGTEETPKDLKLEDRSSFFEASFLGKFEVDRFKRLVDLAVPACREAKRERLLLNLTALEGDLRTIDRFEIGAHGALAAAGLRVSVVASERLVDVRRFGVIVARNRGLETEIFTDREKALGWLLEESAGEPGSV